MDLSIIFFFRWYNELLSKSLILTPPSSKSDKKKSSLIIAILKWNMAMSENATNMYARGREFKMGVVSFTRDKTQLFIWSTYLEFWWFRMCISSVNWFAGIRFTSSDCNGKIRRLIYRNLSNWIPPKVTRHSSMFSQWFPNLSYSPIKI